MIIEVGGQEAIDSETGRIPRYKDLLLPNSQPPSHYRNTGVCYKCDFHKSEAFQEPHGDGRNWDVGCVTICKKHNFVVDSSNCNKVCDDFVMQSWELRGIRSKEERIKILLDLRKDGIEVAPGKYRNNYAGDFDLYGNLKEGITNILDGVD